MDIHGHSNRIYCVKFADSGLIASGGWDSVVYLWDVRTKRSIKQIIGPHIYGEAIDIHGNVMVTGSHKAKFPIEIWDIGTEKCIESANWGDDPKDVCFLYTARFSNDGCYICLLYTSDAADE